MGPTFLVVGDAAGAANPFNGDGVNAALLTGRLAGDVLDEALTTGNSTTLQRYPTLLADAAGQYDKVGRLAARFLGRPAILRPLLRVGMRSDRVMGAALRIATGELRADGAAPPSAPTPPPPPCPNSPPTGDLKRLGSGTDPSSRPEV